MEFGEKNRIELEQIGTITATTVALILTILKVSVGVVTGSVAVIASSLDSLLDMFISMFNTFALKMAKQKPTEKFNYGFGKIEGIATLLEGGLIILSGGFVIFEGIRKLLTHSQIDKLELSIWVMGISMVATTGLIGFMGYIANRTNNIIIRSDLLHYKVDLLTNGAVLIALFLVQLTGYSQIDFILSILIGSYIIKEAIQIGREGLELLLDVSLPSQLVNKIGETIRAHPKVADFHCLKTRKSGPRNFVEVHLVFDPKMSIEEAHRIVEEVEESIRQLDKQVKWIILTHIDPSDDFHINKTLHEC